MEGIEKVEGVFGQRALDKTPLAIIHTDGDEGQAGLPAAAQHTGPDYCLQDLIFPQNIQHQDKTVTAAAIIYLQKNRCN